MEKIKKDGMGNCESRIKIDHEKSIIVVSDLHLGYKNDDNDVEMKKNGEDDRDAKKKYQRL